MQGECRRGAILYECLELTVVALLAYRCAAVLFAGDQILHTDRQPAFEIVTSFIKLSDNQITTLEVLAIAVGLSAIDVRRDSGK